MTKAITYISEFCGLIALIATIAEGFFFLHAMGVK